jgi:hypothetical protein
VRCLQCERPIVSDWYRTRLKDGAAIHVTCQYMAFGPWMPDRERTKALRAWSLVVMPTGTWGDGRG